MERNETAHRTVLLAETISFLSPRDGAEYGDLTVGHGFGGEALIEACGPSGRLLALDVDPVAVEASRRRLARFGGRCRVVQGSYADLGAIAAGAGFGPFDGLVIDAGGVSREQLMDREKGLSFQVNGELDMRLNPVAENPSARDLVATMPERELAALFRTAGETSRRARSISRAICRRREVEPITTTTELAELVEHAVGRRAGPPRATHEATKVFLGLRLAVNREMETLEAGIREAVACLSPGGRLALLTYHGLEHGLARGLLRDMEGGCTCPPDLPVCGCGHQPLITRNLRKPLTPSAAEVRANPSARSARLHVATRTSAPM